MHAFSRRAPKDTEDACLPAAPFSASRGGYWPDCAGVSAAAAGEQSTGKRSDFTGIRNGHLKLLRHSACIASAAHNARRFSSYDSPRRRRTLPRRNRSAQPDP